MFDFLILLVFCYNMNYTFKKLYVLIFTSFLLMCIFFSFLQKPCQGLIPNGLCHSECCSQSCHIGKKCFTCGPFCTSCSNDDLGPNTCGCLCLEVKLRTRRPDGQQRSISAPPNGVQSRHFSTHESTDKSSNIISDRNKENYQVSDIRKGSINRSKDDIQVGGGDILGHKQLSHYDTPKRASFLQQIPGDKSNNATMSDGNSVNMKYEYAQTNGQSNSLKTDFKETFEENAPSYYLTGSTNPSTYSTGDSSRNQSVKWMLNANNSGSSMESGGNSTSRSRRSIRPGQRSQRFPNKILISSKSFGSSGEKSNLSEISFIQSSGNSSLDSTPSQASALNLRRALPPLRHTVKPST